MQHQFQPLGQLRLGRLVPGLVVADRMDPGGAGLGRELQELPGARPAAQHQRAAALAQAGVQRGQAVMEPPALRPADPPRPRPFVIQHIDRDDGSFGDSRKQRRMIADPQVLTQPEQSRWHGCDLHLIGDIDWWQPYWGAARHE